MYLKSESSLVHYTILKIMLRYKFQLSMQITIYYKKEISYVIHETVEFNLRLTTVNYSLGILSVTLSMNRFKNLQNQFEYLA